VQQIMAKHFNAAAIKQREDSARLTADLQKALEGKGLVFNTVDVKAFQQALRKTGFYPQWREKFGAEAWGLVQQYSGELG
jgi:TRAP-type C4-dicarboxylate transport system substrate-binding protein